MNAKKGFVYSQLGQPRSEIGPHLVPMTINVGTVYPSFKFVNLMYSCINPIILYLSVSQRLTKAELVN